MPIRRGQKRKVKPDPVWLVYCTECAPKRVLSAGPGFAISHRLGDGTVHEKVKKIPLDPGDLRVGEEPPSLYLDRISKIYRARMT